MKLKRHEAKAGLCWARPIKIRHLKYMKKKVIYFDVLMKDSQKITGADWNDTRILHMEVTPHNILRSWGKVCPIFLLSWVTLEGTFMQDNIMRLCIHGAQIVPKRFLQRERYHPQN